MARIKDSSVEQVKSASEILPVVEDHVRLRKAGGTYKGLCPFHQERTPSFTVTPARGTFKCFGCGEGGDAISFVQKMEQVDFVGAIEFLARRFGIELEYEEISPEADHARRRRERLEQLLERATAFYERTLWDSDAGAFARDYLAGRGLGEEVCRTFRLGYAPGGPTLARRALQEGFTQEELLAAGLANRRRNDYFSRRLVFPLADRNGKVRGFQARKLHDDDPLQAKYVNSPEGDLFKKGDLLYGLDTARQAIAKADRGVVVEGNTDVLALRQAGFQPVVASMGTALTEAQLRELGRLSKRLFLCFDADAAGTEATLRGMELAVKQGFDVHVVSLAKGTDPADDPAAFERQLAAPVGYLVHRVRLLNERAPDKNAAYSAIVTFLQALPDSPEHLDARKLATDLLDLPPEMQSALAPRGRSTALPLSPRLLDAGQRLERSALAGVAAHDELKRWLAATGPELFDDPLNRRARAYLLGEGETDDELTALLAELYARADEDEITVTAGKQLLLRLRERKLQEELRTAPNEQRQQLAQRVAELREEMESLATIAAADPR
ncbi:MAG: DNA primase [Actinobacteria bacterium]|nr:DNA primase [Actinomycetota bacterium]MBV8480008.1 DNA primase [Actinomycetota bacterium]